MSKKEKSSKIVDVQRLRLRCPGVYSDFNAGRITSLRAALEIAGLRPERSRLQKLKHSWKKAEPEERHAFYNWLLAEGQIDSSESTSHQTLIANGRYLLPETIVALEMRMKARGMTPADVMQDMGFGANDRSLLRAMARKAALRLKVIGALEHWLTDNKEVSS